MIGQVFGELILGGVLILLGGLSLGGVLLLGGLSLGGEHLLGELFLLCLITCMTLGGVGLLDSGDGAGHLRLSTTFLFGEDCLPPVRLLDPDLRGDRLLCLGQGSFLALALLGPLLESGVMDLHLFCFFDFFFLSSFLLIGGEH